MLTVSTEQGTYEFPGTAADINTESGLKVMRNGVAICEFRRWHHWFEGPDRATNTTPKPPKGK